MTEAIKFTIPADREFVGLVRLVLGGAASTLPFDDETVEDIKLVLSEICTHVVLAVVETDDRPDLSFKLAMGEGDLTIDVSSPDSQIDIKSIASAIWDKPQEPLFGLSIITALMDKVELVSNGSSHSVLRLKKFTELPL
jgi:serine/threonine-protein kinase RsbW